MEYRKKIIKRMPSVLCRKRRGRVPILVFFFLLAVTGFCSVCVKAEENASERVEVKKQGEDKLPKELRGLYARSAVLMDADRMRVLVEKDGATMRPMASTTKIMTCILALEEGNLEDVVTASEKAAAQPKVHLGMRPKEQFRLKDLLYSLMLESHNDSAVAIAEHLAGSVEAFAVKMNAKAREIGCENAHFVTPNGLDGADLEGVHSISAADLARIMCYCVDKSPKAEAFLEITQTRAYQFENIGKKRTFSCNNHNLFLDMMEGAISGKTGFTGDAGYCYVGALKKDGRTFAVALLGCGWPNHKSYKWMDTRKLMKYGVEHYEYRKIKPSRLIDPVPVLEGIPEDGGLFEDAWVEVDAGQRQMEKGALVYAGVREKTEFSVLLSEEEKVREEVKMKKRLKAPVKKGEKIGCIRFLLDGKVLEEYPLKAKEDVRKKSFLWIFEKLYIKYLKFYLNEKGRIK